MTPTNAQSGHARHADATKKPTTEAQLHASLTASTTSEKVSFATTISACAIFTLLIAASVTFDTLFRSEMLLTWEVRSGRLVGSVGLVVGGCAAGRQARLCGVV